MEPRRSIDNWEGDVNIESESTSDSQTECEIIGNIEWCDCGKNCQSMDTYTESIYCQDANEIPENFFAGTPTQNRNINK